MLKLPTIIVNFKLYKEATGDRAVELAKIHDKVARETGASIAVAVSAPDLVPVLDAVQIPVFAQHVDPVGFGSNTGKIGPEQLKNLGVAGTLLNHAENQLSDLVLENTLKMCRGLGFLTVCCANTPAKALEIMNFGSDSDAKSDLKFANRFSPDLIAVEPPELIGGDISVSKAEPEVISSAVNLIEENFGSEVESPKLLVGAGVKNSEDVRIALELGAQGVLLASGVVKAEDPEKVLRDLVDGLN